MIRTARTSSVVSRLMGTFDAFLHVFFFFNVLLGHMLVRRKRNPMAIGSHSWCLTM